jgi:hypothetical protein
LFFLKVQCQGPDHGVASLGARLGPQHFHLQAFAEAELSDRDRRKNRWRLGWRAGEEHFILVEK